MNIAIVGATGRVGSKFIQVLEERNIKADNFFLFASKNSEGKKIEIFNKKYIVEELNVKNVLNKKIDYALFSVGAKLSKQFSPIFSENGAVVIDNSSAFRREENVPLVVPEVNNSDILWHKGVISNPNCSTILAVLPLKALDNLFDIKRVIFSTYQAVSGAGQKGIFDLENGIKGERPKKFLHPIFSNIIPHIDDFLENGYTKEEDKMIFETKKILHKDTLKITATTVRVPVFNCHSESINVQFKKPFKLEEVRKALADFDNVFVVDDILNNVYPMPINCDEKDGVYVGRIRRDFSARNALNFFAVNDNIRKGAATNAVQILQSILQFKKEGKL
ncbi:MAG: aspartate-semialdehyde dehydrogenase [Clostridia bacterium]|nr:aspartate-semialdehyde dehydrogenase [Clostridia bacterium]